MIVRNEELKNKFSKKKLKKTLASLEEAMLDYFY